MCEICLVGAFSNETALQIYEINCRKQTFFEKNC